MRRGVVFAGEVTFGTNRSGKTFVAVAMNTLRKLLNPASIALVGASSDFSKVNARPLKHLLEKGYAGRIYLVNPKYHTINGIACFRTIADIPGPIDLAVGAVLNGVRGEPAVDRAALAQLISAVLQFGAELAELNLNPVRAGAASTVAVDWLMICR